VTKVHFIFKLDDAADVTRLLVVLRGTNIWCLWRMVSMLW